MTTANRVILYLYEMKYLSIKYLSASFFNVFLCSSDAIFINDKLT